MFCPKCGTNNNEGSAFCKNCGTPLSIQPGAQPEQSYWQQQPAQPATPKQEGVLAAAWKDITSSPNWIKQLLILCLVGVVPILNFAIEGYSIRWGREVSFGERNPLPTQIFTKKEISTGFFAMLVRFALFCAVLLATLAVAFLLGGMFSVISPVAGIVVAIIVAVIVGIAWAVLGAPFADASIMRMSVVGYLESAFNLPKTFKAFTRAPGGAICASLVPSIAVGAVAGVFSAIVGGIASLVVKGAYNSMYGYSSYGYYGGYDPFSSFGDLGGAVLGILFLYLAVMIISSMLSTFGSLLTYRAMGHWTARTAPEWKDESEELHQK